MSSAYRQRSAEEESLIDVMAFMVIMKKSGPRIEPCGIPEVTRAMEDDRPETTTRWDLFER